MATKQDRIAGLLVQGMRPSMIAGIVGCTESYISQLMKDEDFQYHIECMKKEIADGASSIIADTEDRREEALHFMDKLSGAEHLALDKVVKEMPYMNGREALLALDILGKRKDSVHASLSGTGKGVFGTMIEGKDGVAVRVVEVVIPNICVPELTITGSNEIVAIGNRSVNPMPTATLKQMLSKVDEEPLEAHYEDHSSIAAAL